MFVFVERKKKLRLVSYKMKLNYIIFTHIHGINTLNKFQLQDMCTYIKSNPNIIIGEKDFFFNLNFNEAPCTTIQDNIHEIKCYLDKQTAMGFVVLAGITKLVNTYLVYHHTLENINPDAVPVADLRKVFIDAALLAI